jgi:hypothetical protein
MLEAVSGWAGPIRPDFFLYFLLFTVNFKIIGEIKNVQIRKFNI